VLQTKKEYEMKKTLFVIASIAALGLGSNPIALAQDDDDSTQSVYLEEVLVTATRREESIYDVPVAVSAFTEDMIFRQGIVDITDIGKFVPNMTVTAFGGGQVSSINVWIRGIGIQDHLITTEPGVAVYVDGVYLGRQIGQNWSLSNLERIEVLRGPQGTLYGRNSIGGAVNIITRKPGDESGGRVTANAGTRGRVGGDFYWNQPFSDTFAASITAAYTQRDGVGDFLNHQAKKEVGELSEWNARLAAKWSPTDDFSLLFTYDKADGDNGLRPYTTLIDEVPAGLLYGLGARNSDTSVDPYDNNGAFHFDPVTGEVVDRSMVSHEADGWSITADWAMTDSLSWKFIYADRSSEYETGLDDDSVGEFAGDLNEELMEILWGFDPDLLAGAIHNGERGVLFQYPETGFADQESAELQLFGDFGAWDFVAGLFFFEEEGGNDQSNFFAGNPGQFINRQESESRAIYGNFGFQVTESVRLSVGGRYTEDEKHAFSNPIVGLPSMEGQRDLDEFSWELAASWQMNDRLNLYGTIQNGYQSPQFDARPFGCIGVPGCYVAGDNVTAINYEVGLKGRPVDSLSMAVAVFYTDYSDLPYQISDQEGSAGFNTINLIVDQETLGFEWESQWAPTDNFNLRLTVGYLDVDVKDPNPVVVAPLTPEWNASISPEFTQALANGGSIVWRADLSYRDDMFGQPFSNVPITDIDSRTLINFDVAYHDPGGRWLLAAYGRNVTDEEYDNARVLPTDYVLVILNNDRSEFGLRFMYNFGL
jgi:iron complex outermembrane receptor protein